jgi:hypothetical protein
VLQGFPLNEIPIAERRNGAGERAGDTSLAAIFSAKGKQYVAASSSRRASARKPLRRDRAPSSPHERPAARSRRGRPGGPRLMPASETSPWRHADPLLLALPFAISDSGF